MFFGVSFLRLYFFIFFKILCKKNGFGDPSGVAAGPKMAFKIANAAPKCLPKFVPRSLFGVPNSGSTSGSIFNRFVADLCSFFAVFGAYAIRFWMILNIKIQPFWIRVRFSIPYPPERPNAKHRVSNFGICQDLPESARSLAGSRRNLPRISWSTIASTHLPHIHWPRNASQVTNCQAPKRGGGGDRPLAAFNE